MARLNTDRAMLAAPILFVLLWSSSFIAAKAGLRHLSPLLFVAIRLLACTVVLTLLMLLLRQSWRPLAGWKWLHCAIAGVLLNGIGLMAPHVGLLTAPAAQIALVQSLTPLLTALLGMMLLHERLRIGQWLGLALGTAGVGLVVGEAAVFLCYLELQHSSYRPPSWPRWGHGCSKRLMQIGRKAPSRLWHGIPLWFLLAAWASTSPCLFAAPSQAPAPIFTSSPAPQRYLAGCS
jgi:uncharacterized membrane protein